MTEKTYQIGDKVTLYKGREIGNGKLRKDTQATVCYIGKGQKYGGGDMVCVEFATKTGTKKTWL